MRLTAGCSITFMAPDTVPVIFMLRPRSGVGQWISKEEYLLDPLVLVNEYTDSYGNLCQRLVVPKGKFHLQSSVWVESSSFIDVAPEMPFTLVQDLPHSVLQFLLPSRYCPSDRMGQLAAEIVANVAPGYAQVEAIRTWIQSHITYQYGSSNSSTSALDTLEHRAGVCRDFAHLGIALCRSLNIPARMVVGYLYQLQPMDMHAWFEAFVGDQWYTFDATQAQPKGNRVAIAYGRDAADVALVTQFGMLDMTDMKVWVDAV